MYACHVRVICRVFAFCFAYSKNQSGMIFAEGHSTHIELCAHPFNDRVLNIRGASFDKWKKKTKLVYAKTILCNFFNAHPAFEPIFHQIMKSPTRKAFSRFIFSTYELQPPSYSLPLRSLISFYFSIFCEIMAVNFIVYVQNLKHIFF